MAKELNAKGLDYHIIKQMTGDLISIQEEMMYEGNRLCSFQAWPTNAKAYAFQLVRSGFYYSGEADEVVCFACEGRIRDWQDDDIPMQKHIERYPNCPFVCGQISGINLMPPVLDDGHPTIQLMKRVDEVVVRTSETNQQIAARQFNLEMTNMAVSMTPGQVLVRPVPTQSMDVKRSAITFCDENQRKKSFEGFWSNMWPVTPNTLPASFIAALKIWFNVPGVTGNCRDGNKVIILLRSMHIISPLVPSLVTTKPLTPSL